MARKRLTRQEAQQRTREQLMDAAAIEFARNGFAAASIEQIVERAGFTRGAFYSNFTSKDDLFLAIMDARLGIAAQTFTDALAEHADVTDLVAALRQRDDARLIRRNADAFVLTIEFWLYAMRNPKVKHLLADHYAAVRHAFASVLGLLFDKLGIDPPSRSEDLAAAAVALDTGLLLQRFVDPDAVAGDLHLRMIEALLRGCADESSLL